MEITILEYGYDEREALSMLFQTDSTLNITDISTVYYPYIRYRHELSIGKKHRLVKTKKLSDCVIDRVYGSIYIADGMSSYTTVDADPDEILDIVTPLEECDHAAHIFTLKQFIEKAKLLVTPKIRVLSRDEFYKKYYVVECLDDDGLEYYVLVDAVDGSIAVLDHEKHLDQYVEFQEDFNEREYVAGLHRTIEEQREERKAEDDSEEESEDEPKE